MALSTLSLWGLLVMAAGFSFWGVLLAVFLDMNGVLLVAVYVLAIRPHFPEVPDHYPELLHLKEKADAVIIRELVIPVITAFFLSRISTFIVAKALAKK